MSSPLIIEVLEQETCQYTATLKDELDVVIPAASLNDIELTIRDRLTGAIVNGRDGVSVKNLNNGTIHATSGLFTFSFQVADTTLVGTVEAGAVEVHEGVFTITWTVSSLTRKRSREFQLHIKSSQNLPQT